MAFCGKDNDTNADQTSREADESQNGTTTENGDGGRDAWMTVTGSALVYFASFGVINSYGFFQAYYERDFLKDYASSEIAFIGTMQLGLMYLTSPIVGSLFDVYGIKYLYPIGGIGGTLSLLLLSCTTPGHIWQQFLTQSILFGFTVACGTVPALTIVTQRFHRRRALAMGLVAAGSSAGGASLPIMFSRLVTTIGFAWSTRAAALIVAVCYIIAILITKSKKPIAGRSISITDLFDYRGLRDGSYACLAFGSFVTNLGLYAAYFYAEPYCAIFDPSSHIKQYLLPLINVSGFLGRLCGGFTADKIGRLNVLVPMTLLSGILTFGLWYTASSITAMVAFVSLYGFCSGIFISVLPAATSQILPAEKMGARMGALSSLTAIATLIGNPIAGTLIRTGTVEGYWAMIVYSGSTLLGGGLILLLGGVLHGFDLRTKW